MTDHPRNIKIGTFRVFPIQKIGDNSEQRVEEAKHSGKIILPSFVLRRICRTEQTLMIFKIINEQLGRYIFCGVSSFDGDEQKVAVPLWILKQLQIEAGDKVAIELVMAHIEKGLFAKFEPMTKSFLQITDPKAVLEHCLRSYVCISRGDFISIYYNRNIYELKVCETRPSDTIVINECDLTVDFQEMKETIELPEECDLDQIQSQNTNMSFEAFSGAGQSTGGIKVSSDQNGNDPPQNSNSNEKRVKKIGIPDYDYKIGNIFFKRYKSDLITTDVISNEPQKKSDIQKENNDLSKRVAPRRPVTRSQTQQTKRNGADPNPSETVSTESRPSNQKKRRKNNNQS